MLDAAQNVGSLLACGSMFASVSASLGVNLLSSVERVAAPGGCDEMSAGRIPFTRVFG